MTLAEFIDLVLLDTGAGQILDDAAVQRQDVCALAPVALGAAFEQWYNAQIAFAKRNSSTPVLTGITYETTKILLSEIKLEPLLKNYYVDLPGNVFVSAGSVFVNSVSDADGNQWIPMDTFGVSLIRSYIVGHNFDTGFSKLIFMRKPTCSITVQAIYKPVCGMEDRDLGLPDTVVFAALQMVKNEFLRQADKMPEYVPDTKNFNPNDPRQTLPTL